MMLQYGIPELPERISVETCLIGREVARLQNMHVVDLATVTPTSGQNGNFKSQTTSLLNSGLKTYVDIEISTDSPNPVRDRTLQTEQVKTVSKEVQCNMENDLADAEFRKATSDCQQNVEKIDDLKKRFIDFIKSKTKQYGGGKYECTVCGEIKSDTKRFASHMAIHWGPSRLCVRCGIDFEHTILWQSHNCPYKRPVKRQYIKCPYYSCGVCAISPAELFDHLNEHGGLRPHRCAACKRGFATFDELRLHRKMHKKCLRSKIDNIYKLPREDTLHRRRVIILKTPQGKRMLVKFFLSQLSKQKHKMISRLCCVCLKYCKNVVHFKHHTRRCLDQHKRRLQIQRNGRNFIFKTNLQKTNGIYSKNCI